MSAPHVPGRAPAARSDSRSAAATTRPPAPCTRSVSASRPSTGRSRPDEPGCDTSTPKRLGRVEVGVEVAHDEVDADRLGPGARARRSSADGCRRRRRTRRPDGATGAGTSSSPRRRRWPRRACEALARSRPGEVGHHRLEVEERLQPALADLGLVRRVGRVPGGVLEHVAQDHRRRDRAVSSPCRSAPWGPRCGRPARAGGASTSTSVAGGGQGQVVVADAGRHGPLEQRVDRRRRPTTPSITSRSASVRPRWRPTKSSWCSKVVSWAGGDTGVRHQGPPGVRLSCFPRCRLPSSVASP